MLPPRLFFQRQRSPPHPLSLHIFRFLALFAISPSGHSPFSGACPSQPSQSPLTGLFLKLGHPTPPIFPFPRFFLDSLALPRAHFLDRFFPSCMAFFQTSRGRWPFSFFFFFCFLHTRSFPPRLPCCLTCVLSFLFSWHDSFPSCMAFSDEEGCDLFYAFTSPAANRDTSFTW